MYEDLIYPVAPSLNGSASPPNNLAAAPIPHEQGLSLRSVCGLLQLLPGFNMTTREVEKEFLLC